MFKKFFSYSFFLYLLNLNMNLMFLDMGQNIILVIIVFYSHLLFRILQERSESTFKTKRAYVYLQKHF